MDFQNFCTTYLQKIVRSKAFFCVELTFSIIVGLTICFPFLFLTLSLNELGRLIVKLFLWLTYGDQIELSDDYIGNNYSLSRCTGDRNIVLYLGEVEGVLNVDSVRENYKRRVISDKTYRRLTYTFHQKWMYMCMKKCEDFDIKNHVRYYPGTEDRIVTNSELMKVILPDLNKPMSGSKPQWEEVVIPYYKKYVDEDKSRSLRIIRIHHSYMDGASMLMMIANTFCEDEGSQFPYVIDPCKPLKIPRMKIMLYKLVSLAFFTSSVVRNILSPPSLRARRSRYKVKELGDLVFGLTEKIPIENFRKIKDKSGVSMSAIVSAVLAGALRNLELRFSKKWYGSDKIPETQPLWLVSGMFPYTSNKPCNNHLAIETQLKLADLSGSERLLLNHEELGRLAKNPFVNIYFWYFKILGRIPCIIANALFTMGGTPILLSNIPLCTEPVNFALQGKLFKCKSIVGWVPIISDTGLGIVSVRYGDHFCYCVQADSTVLNEEEMEFFVSQLEKEVRNLVQETSNMKRRISQDTSLFLHENKQVGLRKRGKQNSSKQDVQESVELLESSEDSQSCISEEPNNIIRINNNNINNSMSELSGNVSQKSNYPFLFKIKDSIDQIRDGLKKIKEQ